MAYTPAPVGQSHCRSKRNACALLRVATIFLIFSGVGGCSRPSSTAIGSATGPGVAAYNPDDVQMQYNPSNLREAKQLTDLPVGVQTLANSGPMKDRLDNTPTKFLVGGFNQSSAIVAYEQGGYVPGYYAQSYVLTDSHWVGSRSWRLQGRITELSDLILATGPSP